MEEGSAAESREGTVVAATAVLAEEGVDPTGAAATAMEVARAVQEVAQG